ncbi:hypothetical protein [Chelativorans sp. AA-79]|uniref:hypothetical protein n=1 Tax=Chelativorans sp. AA-79 TaxID=3028735 RepID=UPI0023F6AFF3|nr:hypothetical protein [Chelativorans sp. AA-79]WEX10345.1 hypothetical protein PVE73_05125 [Chelativorans sp. AA-79]
MGDLRELIEKLEKAAGPELVLDGMIWCAVNGYEFVQWDGAGCVYRKVDGSSWDRGIKHISAHEVRPYSASLDAAIALCERVLPGWSWECRVSGTGDKGQATVWNPRKAPGHNDEKRATNCATAAIALVLATLRALEAQEDGRRALEGDG